MLTNRIYWMQQNLKWLVKSSLNTYCFTQNSLRFHIQIIDPIFGRKVFFFPWKCVFYIILLQTQKELHCETKNILCNINDLYPPGFFALWFAVIFSWIFFNLTSFSCSFCCTVRKIKLIQLLGLVHYSIQGWNNHYPLSHPTKLNRTWLEL